MRNRSGPYDLLLNMTERYYGYGDEDYGKAREGDERYWYDQDHHAQSAQASAGPAVDDAQSEEEEELDLD